MKSIVLIDIPKYNKLTASSSILTLKKERNFIYTLESLKNGKPSNDLPVEFFASSDSSELKFAISSNLDDQFFTVIMGHSNLIGLERSS